MRTLRQASFAARTFAARTLHGKVAVAGGDRGSVDDSEIGNYSHRRSRYLRQAEGVVRTSCSACAAGCVVAASSGTSKPRRSSSRPVRAAVHQCGSAASSPRAVRLDLAPVLVAGGGSSVAASSRASALELVSRLGAAWVSGTSSADGRPRVLARSGGGLLIQGLPQVLAVVEVREIRRRPQYSVLLIPVPEPQRVAPPPPRRVRERVRLDLPDLMESKDPGKNKTTKVRQVYLDLSHPGAAPGPAMRAATAAEMDKLRNLYTYRLKREFKKSQAVSDLAAVHQRLKAIVLEAFGRARDLGLGSVGTGLPPEAQDAKSLFGAVTEEMEFLKAFFDDYRNDTLRMPFDQRLGMYGRTLDGVFYLGAVAALPSDVVVSWNLGIAEHCKTCLKLAAGSPYTKPGVGKHPLPTVPRAGHTQCLSNCKCWLAFTYDGKAVGPTPSLTMNITSAPPELKPAARAKMQTELDAMYRKMAYHRQMLELTTGKEKDTHIRARRALNQRLIELADKAKIKVSPGASVDDILRPVEVAKKAHLVLAKDNMAKLTPGATVRVLDGLEATIGKVTSRSGNKVSLRTASKALRVVWLTDVDNTILFV